MKKTTFLGIAVLITFISLTPLASAFYQQPHEEAKDDIITINGVTYHRNYYVYSDTADRCASVGGEDYYNVGNPAHHPNLLCDGNNIVAYTRTKRTQEFCDSCQCCADACGGLYSPRGTFVTIHTCGDGHTCLRDDSGGHYFSQVHCVQECNTNCGHCDPEACCPGWVCHFNKCHLPIGASCSNYDDCCPGSTGFIGCAYGKCCGRHAFPCSDDSQCCSDPVNTGDFYCSTKGYCTLDCGSTYCTPWADVGCGQGGCASNEMYQTRTCTNRGCSESQCVYEPACECTSHAYSACYDNDRYWYDSCGAREEKREECGSDSCGSWYTCSECWNARYEKECQDCVDRGCLSDACFANNYQNTRQGTDCGTDTCSDSGSSWYIKEYVDDNEGCSGGSCGSDTRNWDFCSGDVVHDRTCSGSDLGADLTHNCNVDDGWYCNVDVRENRDYSCSDGACVYSVSTSEDCSTKASTDSDAGNVPLASGTCTDYTGCSNGACSTTPYPDTCISGTQLREHYNSGSFCTFEIYDCSDFEAAATGDTSDDPTTTGTCTAGTGATCSSGAFSTASGSSGTEGCIDPNACPGGANCVFREYYAIDSTDACPGLDTCVSKTYDPDTNPNTCQACLGSGRYDIGGIANCCGDDNSEHKLTRVCQDGVGWSVCATSPSDDACCDQTSDCIWNNACYNNGADHPGVAGAKCDNGIWKDKTSPITTITVSGTEGWNSWYTSDVQVTFSCSDTGGSGCDVTMYCVDTTDTCSPSISYSSPFTVSNEGVNYVRYFSRDNAGNQETLQLMQVKIDKTDPIFNSYSVSGCDYKDIDNKICWAGPGTATIHDIQHTDSVSTPYVQYLAFTNNCNPNNCGCGWDQLCVSGDEIKSSVETDTGILTSHMWNDDYINIQSASCVGSCTGASVDEQWSVVTGSSPKDYRIYAFLYDEAGRGTGYTDTGWRYIIDTGGPQVSIVINNGDDYTNSASVTLSLNYSDPGGSGVDACRYMNEGGSWTAWESCVNTREWTLTSGDGVKIVYYEVRDLMNNTQQDSDSIILDTIPPSTSASLSGTSGSNGWYISDVQVSLVCSDSSGGCDTTYYCVDTTNTCSPSITYSSPFTVSNEGTNYIRYYSTDNAGNTESTKSAEIKIDKTNPTLDSYSVTGCDYKDTNNNICWVKSGTATTHEIVHSDPVSSPSRQYLVFTSGCDPNNCGCGWDQLCVSGDEIKSSVETDTGILTSHMWNDDYINIQSASCVGSCTGASVDEQWSVVTGSSPKDYRIYAFLYDEAGRATGYSPTGWEQRTDSAPPVSSVSELPPYTEGGTIDLYWGGSDGGSGIDCYTIQFQYNDTESLSGWQDFLACTTQTFETFNAFEEAGSPPDGIGNYTFYFRSLAKDLVGNTETKTTADTQTIIFIPELAETYVVDEFDNSVPNNGKTAASRMVSIIIINKTEDQLDMTINYSTHSPASEPSTWSTTRCQNAYTCAVTLGPFKNDTKVDYYTYVYDSSTGKSERNPPESYYSFTMYEHPIANFMTNILMPTIGRSDLIDIKVRNIHLKADAVHLKLEPDNVIFSENGQQEIDIYMNPQEEKTIYARVLFSDNLRYKITLAASSSIDSDLTDKDSLWVTVVYAPDFPGLSNFAIVLLLIMAVLIYAKFVRSEN